MNERMKCCRYRILFPVKVDNLLWWASVLMFIGATGFNISNIAGVLYGDVPLNLTVNQQVCMAYAIPFFVLLCCHGDMHMHDYRVTGLNT